MKATLKRSARRVLPASTVQQLRQAQAALVTRNARKAFEAAPSEPRWLDPERLPELQRRAPAVPPYPYDPDALLRRGAERTRDLAPFLQRTDRGAPRTLEIACSDGMVSRQLRLDGADAVALDMDDSHFDARAREAGVPFVAGDAMALPFEDRSFDVAFTYNAFEHFGDPRGALEEALRVVRPGGTLYARFGPLYRAPFGLHAFHTIRVPYCQHLFERDVLAEFSLAQNDRRIEFETLNEWTVRQFRELWDAQSHHTERTVYREIPDVGSLDLIGEFPSCFRSETEHFEDLTIAIIEIALRRTA